MKRHNNGQSTRFQPGHPGGPGRPKGLMTLVREQTRDGAELVEIMLGIARNGDAKDADRIKATEWLADRGFGKVAQPIEDARDDADAILARLTAREMAGRREFDA